MEEEKVESQVVTEQGSSRITELWKTEDYWAIWLGFFILILGLIIYLPRGPADMQAKIDEANATLKAESERAPFKTIAWHKAVSAKKKLRARSSPAGKKISKFTIKAPDVGAESLKQISFFHNTPPRYGIPKA